MKRRLGLIIVRKSARIGRRVSKRVVPPGRSAEAFIIHD